MTRLVNLARHNAIALAALFIALGGTSYAAISLPANSVGARQIQPHSISPIKFQRNSIAGYVRDWARVDQAGHVTASRPRAHTVDWGETGQLPGGIVSWGQPIPKSCFALATASLASSAPHAYASAAVLSAGHKNSRFVGAQVSLSAPQTAVSVAVICPQP